MRNPESDGAHDRGAGTFCQLYGEVAGSLHAWAVLRTQRGLKGFLEPSDLVQEVCYRAFVRFATFDMAKGTFRRWVFGIATNVLHEVLDEIAKPGRRGVNAVLSSLDLLESLPDDATSVSRAAARREDLARFLTHLNDLDEADQRLLIYRGLEGLTHSEIATILGESRDTIAKRWQRLVAHLEAFRPPDDLLEP